uniref:Uncharacterized protein n=1 Tax=Arundo donax TaxID=35708 RepID=A0A0A9DWG4_ARUDO
MLYPDNVCMNPNIYAWVLEFAGDVFTFTAHSSKILHVVPIWEWANCPSLRNLHQKIIWEHLFP